MMAHTPAHAASLSVHRAFVVEFDTDADLQAGRVTGRVEHVVSGRATLFQSPEIFLAFMAQVLGQVRGDSTQMSRKETT
jgi:hypothetical protein